MNIKFKDECKYADGISAKKNKKIAVMRLLGKIKLALNYGKNHG